MTSLRISGHSLSRKLQRLIANLALNRRTGDLNLRKTEIFRSPRLHFAIVEDREFPSALAATEENANFQSRRVNARREETATNLVARDLLPVNHDAEEAR